MVINAKWNFISGFCVKMVSRFLILVILCIVMVIRTNAKLEFDITLIPHIGDDSWVESKIKEAYECLMNDKLPNPSLDCDYCTYRKVVMETLDLK